MNPFAIAVYVLSGLMIAAAVVVVFGCDLFIGKQHPKDFDDRYNI